MVMPNNERVGRALDAVRDGIRVVCEAAWKAKYGADWLTERHFRKNLIDQDVEILDPATGTGTFICELLEHFRGQPQICLRNT